MRLHGCRTTASLPMASSLDSSARARRSTSPFLPKPPAVRTGLEENLVHPMFPTGFLICGLLLAVRTEATQPLAFVTSFAGTGDMHSWPGAGTHTGLAAADAVCQARAAGVPLPQPELFVAWLSDDDNDAYCRVLGLSGKAPLCGQAQVPPALAGPWWRTDGETFAGDLDDFSIGRIFRPLDVDEFGVRHAAARPYTASSSLGRKAQTYATCLNWTGASAANKAKGGTLSGTTKNWSEFNGIACNTPAPIYCLLKGQGDYI